MTASTMRKMQVAAYVPREDGVQELEKRGVWWLLLKTIAIDIEWDECLSDMPLPMSMPMSMVELPAKLL